MVSVPPSLLEAVRSGDGPLVEEIISEHPEVKDVGIPSLYALLSSSIEGGIHLQLFNILLSKKVNQEREASLLKFSLCQGNIKMAWMILNRWKKFDKLDLSSCNLRNIPSIPARHRENIKDLDLSGNQIEFLPLYFDQYPNLKNVKLTGNPLTVYPDKCKRSWVKMKEFLQDVERDSKGIYKKLTVVGESTVRKSLLKALRKRFLKENYSFHSSDSNHSIHTSQAQVTQIESKEMIFNIWDMGDINNVARNFLLTSHSVYIICIDIHSPNAMDCIGYWFQLIQSLCKICTSDRANIDTDESSAVFIVAEEQESKVSSKELVDSFEEQIQELIFKTLFRGFQRLFSVNCKSGRGLRELMESITQFISNQAGQRYGISDKWVLFNHCLQRKKQENSYLNWKTYKNLSKSCNIESSVLPSCTNFLRDVGTLLCFSSGFGDQNTLMILNPQWFCESLECIFQTEQYIFSREEVHVLLESYSKPIRDYIIDLLLQYNVVHELDRKHLIVPSLLSHPCPSTIRQNWSTTIDITKELEQQRLYRFSFVPLEFFSRVIVRILRVRGVIGAMFWKNGVLLQLPSTKQSQNCILTYNENTYELLIRVRISNEGNLDASTETGMLFRTVIEVVEVLLESFYPRLVENTRRLVPCTHCINLNVPKPYLFTYMECIKAATSENNIVYCNHINSPSRKVSIVKLAPDIAFADLPHIDVNELELDRLIGEGNFGAVKAGILNDNSVAVKQLKDVGGEEGRSIFWEFQQETCIMSSLQHPNIIQFYGVSAHPPQIVMELLQGDLCDLLLHPLDPSDSSGRERIQIDPKSVSWKLKMKIAFDIAQGMQYLQNIDPPVIHRDLRSPNILMVSLDENASLCAKVGDFGLARCITSPIAGSLKTWQWLAPEVILENGEGYGLESDVYSFGVVLWELVSFRYPYDEFTRNPRYSRRIIDGNGMEIYILNPYDVKQAILNEQLRPSIPDYCNSDISALIERCWDQNPKKRPNFNEIVYLLSLQLDIKLDSVNFKSVNFKRYNRPLDLSCVLSENSIQDTIIDNLDEKDVYIQKTKKLLTKDYFVSCMQAIEHLNHIWTGSHTGSLIVRNFDGSIAFTVSDSHTSRITSILLVDNKHVWTSSSDGWIIVWDIAGKRKGSITTTENHDTIKCLFEVVLPDGSSQIWSSTPRGKKISCWNRDTFELIHSFELNQQVHAIVQHSGYVWLGTDDGTVVKINYNTLESEGSWKVSEYSISSLLWNKKYLWIGTDSGVITIWKYNKNNLKKYRETPASVHLDSITSIQMINSFIWTSSNDHSLIIWCPQRIIPLKEYKDHCNAVLSITEVGSSIAWTSSLDGTIIIWDTSALKSKELAKIKLKKMDSDQTEEIITLNQETPKGILKIKSKRSVSSSVKRLLRKS